MASYSYGKTVQTDTVTGETFWGDFDRRHAFNAAAAYRVSDRTRVAVVFRGATNVPIAGYFAARDGAVVVGGGFLGFGVFGICVNQFGRPVTTVTAAVGLARTFYSSVFAKGREISFQTDTLIQAQLAPDRKPEKR